MRDMKNTTIMYMYVSICWFIQEFLLNKKKQGKKNKANNTVQKKLYIVQFDRPHTLYIFFQNCYVTLKQCYNDI